MFDMISIRIRPTPYLGIDVAGEVLRHSVAEREGERVERVVELLLVGYLILQKG